MKLQKRILKVLMFTLLLSIFLVMPKDVQAAEKQYSDNVIPTMTSNTSPSGTAKASSIYSSGGWEAFRAFDNIAESGWVSSNGTPFGWLEYDFQTPKCIEKYTLTPRSVGAEYPKDWTFEAWDEASSTWIVLDTRSNVDSWTLTSKKEFTFSNTAYYSKYRINITAGHSQSFVGIGQLEMMEVLNGPVESSVLKLILEKNEVKQLSVSEELEDNTNLIWTSSDITVATVDANGKVKALKPGDTVITCTSEDGDYTDTIKVLVVDLDYQLAVDLFIGEKCRLTVDDAKDTAKVIWTVNDPAIASVTSKGKVTAVGEGLTFITVTDEDGKEIGKIFIRVRITE